MDAEKLKKMQAQVRIGGKGTPRRKKKIVHQNTGTDDRKLQGVIKKLNANAIPAVEKAFIIKNDGSAIHFNNPKVQASLSSNTFVITGQGENKTVDDFTLPFYSRLLEQFNLAEKSKLAAIKDDDEVPDLVENFVEVVSKELDNVAIKNISAQTENINIT